MSSPLFVHVPQLKDDPNGQYGPNQTVIHCAAARDCLNVDPRSSASRSIPFKGAKAGEAPYQTLKCTICNKFCCGYICWCSHVIDKHSEHPSAPACASYLEQKDVIDTINERKNKPRGMQKVNLLFF